MSTEKQSEAGCMCLPRGRISHHFKRLEAPARRITGPIIAPLKRLEGPARRFTAPIRQLGVPVRTKVDEWNEKRRNKKEQIYDEDVDLFEENYDSMLRSNSIVVPGDDEFDELPTVDMLEELYDMQILDRNRQKIRFGDVVQDTKHRRHVVVFIRHFFCGNCYGFVRALTTEMPLHKVQQLRPSTRIIVIGCGDPVLIPQYLEQTGCPYEVFADPSRTLYRKLGLAITTAPPPEMPRYVKKYSLSFMKNIGRSLKLTAKTGKLSGGPIVQVGGELVWIDGELQHMHRMKNAGDHMDTTDLVKLLRRQERELLMREGSVRTRDDGNSSKRNSFTRALSRLSSVGSIGSS